MNSKYSLKDLKRRPESQPLPEDVNEDVEILADRIKDPDLKNALIDIRKKHYYGTHYHRNGSGEVDAYFEFCYGVCIRCRLVKEFNVRNSFHMNVINKKVSLKNGDYDDGEEKGRLQVV
jgi:hypothetical protein